MADSQPGEVSQLPAAASRPAGPVTSEEWKVWKELIRSEAHPFINRTWRLGPWAIVETIFAGIILMPIRLVFLGLISAALLIVCGLGTIGLNGDDLKKPLPRWRKVLIWPVPPLLRAVLFFLSIHWISIKGKQGDKATAPILISNHLSWIEPLALVAMTRGTPVSAEKNLKMPIIASCLIALQALLVARQEADDAKDKKAKAAKAAASGSKPQAGGAAAAADTTAITVATAKPADAAPAAGTAAMSAQRAGVRADIYNRATNEGFPPILIFPEGTCTNGTAVISFKTGAFAPGLPVQPVLVIFPWADTHFDPSWVTAGPGLMGIAWRLISRLHTPMELHFMQPYNPSPAEIANPRIYAANVQRLMAHAMGVHTSQHSYEDVLLSIIAHKAGFPVDKAVIEFEALRSALHVDAKVAQVYLERFIAADKGKTGRITFDQFKNLFMRKIEDKELADAAAAASASAASDATSSAAAAAASAGADASTASTASGAAAAGAVVDVLAPVDLPAPTATTTADATAPAPTGAAQAQPVPIQPPGGDEPATPAAPAPAPAPDALAVALAVVDASLTADAAADASNAAMPQHGDSTIVAGTGTGTSTHTEILKLPVAKQQQPDNANADDEDDEQGEEHSLLAASAPAPTKQDGSSLSNGNTSAPKAGDIIISIPAVATPSDTGATPAGASTPEALAKAAPDSPSSPIGNGGNEEAVTLSDGDRQRERELRALFDLLDVDECGTLDFRELLVGLTIINQHGRHPDQASMQQIFNFLDPQGKGRVTKAQLQSAFRHVWPNMTDEALDEAFQSAPEGEDGKINAQEFTTWIKGRPELMGQQMKEGWARFSGGVTYLASAVSAFAQSVAKVASDAATAAREAAGAGDKAKAVKTA